jgi:hypothetical protein
MSLPIRTNLASCKCGAIDRTNPGCDIVTQLSIWRRSAVARPASRAVSTARTKSGPAASSAAPSSGGGLPLLIGWAVLFVLLVVAPVIMLAYGAEPGVILMWMAMIIVSLAITWWTERREQRRWRRLHGKPRQSNFPCAEAYQSRWGTEESHAPASPMRENEGRATPMAHEAASALAVPVWWLRWLKPWERQEVPPAPEPIPAFVVNALPSVDGVYDARFYTVCDAVMDAHSEALAAGLSREDTIERMAHALSGAKPASRGKQQAGGGAGGQRVPRGRG